MVALPEPLKNQLSFLNYEQTVIWTLNKLAYVEKKGILNTPGWTPWYLIMFLKYATKFCWNPRYGIEAEILSTYINYNNFIITQPDTYLGPERQDAFRFLLRLAHQQFDFQISEAGLRNRIARQELFFSFFDKDLESSLGFSTREFLQMSFFLFAHIKNGDRIISPSLFKLRQHSKPKVLSLFKFISVTADEIRADFENKNIDTDAAAYDFSPFRDKPLLKLRDNYFTVSLSLLNWVISYGIYNHLSKSDGYRIKFGPIFEDYLHRRLKESFPSYISEKEFREKIPAVTPAPSAVDAFLQTEKYQILIEFKASELPHAIRVDPTTDNLRFIKNNFIKGIAQGIKCAKFINNNANIFPNIDSQKEKILLIVSYKETYLSSARMFWEHFLPALQNDFQITDAQEIPSKNIIFVSIDDFDWLLVFKSKLDEILCSTISRLERNEAHTMSQILQEFHEDGATCEELDERFENIVNPIVEELREAETASNLETKVSE